MLKWKVEFFNLVDLILWGTTVKIQFSSNITTILGVLPSSHNVVAKWNTTIGRTMGTKKVLAKNNGV
jgi:hypothetical protein